MKRAFNRLRVPNDVAGLIRGLHPQLKRKLRAALEEILDSPQAGKPLKEELAGLWSFRVGRFRVIYRIAGRNVIEIVAFGPREHIYEVTFQLVSRGR